jgi:hypothetical protein
LAAVGVEDGQLLKAGVQRVSQASVYLGAAGSP